MKHFTNNGIEHLRKTKTGLYIIEDGKRIDVHTLDELKQLQNQSFFKKLFKRVLKALKF